jgi:hypothetical protein
MNSTILEVVDSGEPKGLASLQELSDLDLALIGGGIADTILA